ncbi:Rv0361 family membrane protein [Blastococcus sp. SYSU D00820]
MTTHAHPPVAAQSPTAAPATSPGAGIRSRDKLILGGGALAVVLAGGLTTLATATAGPDSPAEAVQDYLAAQQDGDWETAYLLMCAERQEDAGSPEDYAALQSEDGFGNAARMQFRVGDVDRMDDEYYYGDESALGGDVYTVDVTMRWYGESDETTAYVLDQDGDFRVCGGI